MACASLCSPKFLVIFFLLSAIPIGYLISLELAKPTTHVYHYHSTGWLRECAKWDDLNRRFLVSFLGGGIGEIPVPEDEDHKVLQEVAVVKHVDLAGNASLGLVIDRPRNRLLVATADVKGNRYGALAAYDLSTWERVFLTQLSGPSKIFLGWLFPCLLILNLGRCASAFTLLTLPFSVFNWGQAHIKV